MKLKGTVSYLIATLLRIFPCTIWNRKSYEPYEYVADDYYKLDQTLTELNVDSNIAGFGAETDTAESTVEIERSQEVIISEYWLSGSDN